MNEANAIVFHMPTLPEDVLKRCIKRNGQLWVFWSMESEAHSIYKWQYEPEVFGLFDITMTYKLASDVPTPYFSPVYYDYEILRQEPVAKTGLANAFISSNFDQSKRLKYLKELMSYIEIHSYGRIMNNRPIANDEGIITKANIISRYKFTLVFENAISKDYVTEKFIHPLIMGSIPVYLGAPNIADFAPDNHCYIDVNAFYSIKELADYLLELDNNQDQYEKYLSWKKHPFTDKFIFQSTLIKIHPFINLCNIIKEKLQN